MLNGDQFSALKSRVESGETSEADIRRDAVTLLSEVMRLTFLTNDLSAQALEKLSSIEDDLVRLEKDIERLRGIVKSTYFERDASIGLLARMATGLGMKSGRIERTTEHGVERRVIVDLPSGQVSWEYLEPEAHLFEALPIYEGALEERSVQDTYMTVMNPGLSV
mgnify:CR=1 FL=1